MFRKINVLFKENPAKLIFIFLATVLIVSLIGIIVLAVFSDVTKESFGRSISDTFLDIISVGVLGTLFSLLLAEYNFKQQQIEKKRETDQQTQQKQKEDAALRIEKEKEKWLLAEKNRDQYRKDVLLSINKLYIKIKNARRMLRAKGFARSYYKSEDDNNPLSLSVYDEAMDDINNSQLELEFIKEEIKTNGSAFSDPANINTNLEAMEKYLGEFVSEYETHRASFSGEPPSLRIGALTEVKGFIAQAKVGDFKKEFSEKCNEIRKLIRTDINFYTLKITAPEDK